MGRGALVLREYKMSVGPFTSEIPLSILFNTFSQVIIDQASRISSINHQRVKMKASVVFAMVSAMMAPSSAAMPAPMKNYTNATLPYLPLGVAVEVRGEKENGMPACSVPCIENAIQKMTDCDVTDYACACKHHGKISSAASGCVVGSCGLKKALSMDYLSIPLPPFLSFFLFISLFTFSLLG